LPGVAGADKLCLNKRASGGRGGKAVNEIPRPGDLAADIDWAGRARALAPMIEAAAPRTEQARQVADDVMAALHEAQLFRMAMPRSLGGGEATPMAVTEVMEIVAAADASTAWCLGQAMGCTYAGAYLDPAAARDIFAAPDAVLAWGPGSRSARAVADGDGYRVSGEWMFASGSRHATWIGAHCPIFEADGETPRMVGGRQVIRSMMFPKSSAKMVDVWHVMGLRGTGSDNYVLDGLYVPETHSYRRDNVEDRRVDTALYRIPLLTFYGFAFAGVAMGIARAMLDALIELAETKVAGGASGPLRENAVIQSKVAEAEGKLASARAYLMQMLGETYETGLQTRDFPTEQRARLRVAITTAMDNSRQVVEFAYNAAGATAIFESQPFERRFRDMHAVTQQGQAHLSNYEVAGQVLLGLPSQGHRL
jgi:alkylation response protein AidB-like acyl-CoA dehydrogenase